MHDPPVHQPAPEALLSKFAKSEAVAAADPAKVKAFADASAPIFKAIPKSATICLPPAPLLEKLALSQLELGGTADAGKVKAFEAASKAAGKTIPTSKLLSLAPEAKKLPGIRTAMTGAELADQKRLRAALPVLEQKLQQAAKERARYGP